MTIPYSPKVLRDLWKEMIYSIIMNNTLLLRQPIYNITKVQYLNTTVPHFLFVLSLSSTEIQCGRPHPSIKYLAYRYFIVSVQIFHDV